MKRFILLSFLFFVFFSHSKAQTQVNLLLHQDSTAVEKDSLQLQVRKKVISIDSTMNSVNNQADSLKASLQSIPSIQANDSLQNLLGEKLNWLDSTRNSFTTTPIGFVNDTLNNISSTDKVKETLQNEPIKHITGIDSTFTPITGVTDFVDSLSSIPAKFLDSAAFKVPELKQANLKEHLNNPETDMVSTDSAGISQLVSKGIQEKIEQKHGIKVPDSLGGLKLSGEQIDQIAENELSKMEGMKEFNEHSAMADRQPEQLMNSQEGMSSFGNPEEMKSLGSEAVQEEVTELMSQNGDQLQSAQEKMTELKAKYSKVPNSNDMSTAIKITSLQGAPLKERIVFGSNFMVGKGNPFTVDLAPLVMYKFNKVFWAGISGSYKASIKYEERSVRTNAQDVIGFSALARHMVTKGFFGYVEFETKGSTVSFKDYNWNHLPTREWQPGLLAGLGKQVTLHRKFKGAVIVTYNFLESGKRFSRSPFEIKFSFFLDDLKGKKE